MDIKELNRNFGNIDIYLFDQLLKGKINSKMKVLDAGCGEGRNLVYMINNNFDVYGVDQNSTAIRMLQMSARKKLEPERFVLSTIEDMLFPPNVFDYIISSAVLHFAKSREHFDVMITKMLETLKPGGTLFIRMCTDLGIEPLTKLNDGVYKLGDGSERYLFEVGKLNVFLTQYDLTLIEPLKSVVVHEQRSMGVLILQKN